jgi:hypothetical protein
MGSVRSKNPKPLRPRQRIESDWRVQAPQGNYFSTADKEKMNFDKPNFTAKPNKILATEVE